jgi:hypothetical protein
MDEKNKYPRSSLDSMIPNNSDKAKREKSGKPDERKKIKPVVTGKVVKQKKSVWRRLKENILGDDTRSVADYMVHDVLIPAFKSTLSDMVGGGIEMLLFGERRRGNTYYRDRGRTYVSYNNYFRDDRDRDRRSFSRSARARHDFDDIVFETRAEAEKVLANLVDLTIEYNRASVMDFYELCNIDTNYTDDAYGWTNLREAYTDRVRNGYIICLPPPRPLD